MDPYGKTANPVRQLPDVHNKDFQERMGGIDLDTLPAPEAILRKRSAEKTRQDPKTDAYKEQVAVAIADQMTRHQDEWSDLSARHARIMDRERGKLSSFYRMRETAFKIESVKAKLDAPKLLPGFARKFLRLDDRLESQREVLKANQSTAQVTYAKEELVAEMGAAFLAAHAGIVLDEFENAAAYLKGWLQVLKAKENKRWIVEAAGQAQKATDFILDR